MEKRIIFIAAALASCLAAGAQTPDTLRIKNVSEVTVITSKDSQTISLKGSANDSTFRYESSVKITPDSNVSVRESRLDLFSWDILQDRRESRRAVVPQEPDCTGQSASATGNKKRKYSRVTTNELEYIGLGVAFPYPDPEGMHLGGKALSDIFINIESARFNFAWNHLHFSSGVNAGYRSFRLMEDGILSVQNGEIAKDAVPQGLELKRSALRSNYISVPATLGLSFARYGRFEIYGGAEICFNFNGRIKNKYSQKEVSVPVKYTDISLERFTWNYIAGINFEELGIYAKYSPCPFLKKGAGPDFNTYSVGIRVDLP